MVDHLKLIIFLNNFLLIYCGSLDNFNAELIFKKHYVFWPNATVPFFINPEHFDHEQSLSIMTTLSMFAFKTCLKFAPVMAPPQDNQHVLTFINPEGLRRCVVDVQGHSVFDPHYLIVGYDCLKAPHLEMLIMKALGFPFEHNRRSRDVFVEVLFENIEPGSLDLYTKDMAVPEGFQNLPYDYNSVMHFGDRDYSKNGHRTIIFRDHKTVQNRQSLSPTDLRKIQLVYGPECLKRDRQEKVDLCQEYPGVARRKRGTVNDVNVTQERGETNFEPDINDQNTSRKKRDLKDVFIRHINDLADEEHEIDNTIRVKRNTDDTNQETRKRNKRNVQLEPVIINLRVNRNIAPPPDSKNNVTETLKLLGIEDGVMEIIEAVYKVSSLALKNARAKYCNDSRPELRTGPESKVRNSSDILGIIESVTSYAASMVDNALANLTVFCENSGSIDEYQRARCLYNDGRGRCPETYRSTKTGQVRYSTQHRPTYFSYTKHDSGRVYHHYGLRTENGTESLETATEVDKVTESIAPEKIRKKREADVETDTMKLENEIQEAEQEKAEEEEYLTSVDKGELTTTDVILGRRKRKVESKEIQTTDVNKDNLNIAKISLKDQVNLNSNKSTVNDLTDEAETTISNGIETIVGDVKKMDVTVSTDNLRRVLLKERKHSVQTKPALRSKDEETESGESQSETSDTGEKYKKKKSIQKERKGEFMTEKESGDKRFEEKARNVRKLVSLSKANSEFYRDRKWLNGVVPYIIKEESAYDIDDLRDRIAEVNDILHKKTCVRLKEITERSGNKYEDYLVLDTSLDYVTGRVGGRQHFGSLELFRGNQHKQHTAMMVMAMLGFYFELSRHDRDKYVRVHMRHVRPDKLHHFEKIREEATFALPYDYESATHPAWQFWRKIGKTGISTVATYKNLDPDSSIMQALGQHDKLLSDLDIVKINSVYGVKCFRNAEKREILHID